MTTSALKHLAVVAMTQFGRSGHHLPTEDQVLAVEEYYTSIGANTGAPEHCEKQRYMALHRILLRCVSALSQQQYANVYLWLNHYASDKGHRCPEFQR